MSKHTVSWDTYNHTHMCRHTRKQVYVCNLSHVQNHSSFIFFLLYILCKEKFFIEGFFIEDYIQEIENVINCEILKKTITCHYLILTYFYVRTFMNNVSVWSQPESPGQYTDSWCCTVPLREKLNLLATLLVDWSYQLIKSLQHYTDTVINSPQNADIYRYSQ